MRGCSASELHRSCLRVDLFFILSMVGGYFFLTRRKVSLLATGNQKKSARVLLPCPPRPFASETQKKKTTKTENCRRTGPRPRPPLHVQLNQRPITKPVQIHSRYAAERFRHQADSEARWPRHGSAGEGLAGHRTLAHVRVPQGSGERRRGARSLDQPVR